MHHQPNVLSAEGYSNLTLETPKQGFWHYSNVSLAKLQQESFAFWMLRINASMWIVLNLSLPIFVIVKLKNLPITLYWGKRLPSTWIKANNAAQYKCGVLRNLVQFLQFKKREKHPWKSATFIPKTCWNLQDSTFILDFQYSEPNGVGKCLSSSDLKS